MMRVSSGAPWMWLIGDMKDGKITQHIIEMLGKEYETPFFPCRWVEIASPLLACTPKIF